MSPGPADPTLRALGRERSRREFVRDMGTFGVFVAVAAAGVDLFVLPDDVLAVKLSAGYLLVDSRKCSGCMTCSAACSIVHHGVVDDSRARIQVEVNPFGAFPDDIRVFQCWQCKDPACVHACPVDALLPDPVTGVRVVDPDRCIGCLSCVLACIRDVSVPCWDDAADAVVKCDLCADTPFWDEEGGIDGSRACERVCPMNAIRFTNELPREITDYAPDLSGPGWKLNGFRDVAR